MTPADAATQAVHAFLETFNAQDHEAHAQTLNYPHVRLAGGRFARLESSEEFTAISAKGEMPQRRGLASPTSATSLSFMKVKTRFT